MQERSDAQKCDRENDLIAFLYGECNETEARNFEQHLRTCAGCESDLVGFRNIRGSMAAWRSEVLGATEAVNDSRPAVTRQRSAVAAVREFFNLSPLWLKGAVAVASILFCLFAALTVFNMRNQSKPSMTSNDNKVYTQEELNRKIDEAVAAAKQQFDNERSAQAQNESQSDQPAAPHCDSVAAHSKSRPLSTTEREQLAADLRLISSDEPSLDLLGDRINQEE